MATEEGIPHPTAEEFASRLQHASQKKAQNGSLTPAEAQMPYGLDARDSSHNAMVRKTARKPKEQTLMGTLCSVICQHQIGMAQLDSLWSGRP